MLLGLYYFITFLYCLNPASGLQYRNKRIYLHHHHHHHHHHHLNLYLISFSTNLHLLQHFGLYSVSLRTLGDDRCYPRSKPWPSGSRSLAFKRMT